MSYRIGPWCQFCWAPQEEYGHHELGIISSRAYMMTLEAKGAYMMTLEAKGILHPYPNPDVSVVH
jgi:hypothetical protein